MAIHNVLIVDDSKTELMYLTDLLKTPRRRYAAWLSKSPT
jgi:hypothetical protein